MRPQKGIINRKKVSLFAAIFLVAALALVYISFRDSKEASAQIVNFYPTTCLGGWSNPQNVTGEPAVTTIGDRYDESNSAVYSDNQASLYCGGYAGEIPVDTKHTEVVLRFSWTQNVEEAPLSYPTLPTGDQNGTTTIDTTASSSADSTASSSTEQTESTPPAADIPSEEVPVPEPLPIPEPVPEPELEPVSEPAAEPSPEPEPLVEETVSFFQTFISTAHAQESVAESAPGGAQFRVEFTLDGATWSTLGYISDVSNDIKLTFPRDTFLNVEDIARVQIGLVPLITIDSAPEPVYLDAMWLEVEYTPVLQTALHNAIEHTPAAYSFSEISFSPATSTVADLASSTASTSTEPLITPDSIVRIHGIDKRFVLVHVKATETQYRLWLFDLMVQEATVIADEVITIGEHKGGIKDRMVFWYSAAKDKIYIYDLRTAGAYHELLVVQNLPEQSEALVYEFPFTTWKLVDGPEEFYFRSDETGEVFSDGIAEGMAQFVLTFKLYNEWSKEDMDNLGLSGL